MADSNRHAYVVPVVLEPHPDPETTRLSIVRVNAYTCVVNTEQWQGIDKAIYIQPDTVVPDIEEFAFLKRNNSARAQLEKDRATLTDDDYTNRIRFIEDGEKADIKKLRITAKKLRGVNSFGMLWPLEKCPLCADLPEPFNHRDLEEDKYHFVDGFGELPCVTKAQVGDDLWVSMGFKRYDPPLPKGAGDEFEMAPDLPWIHEYDVENYYNYPDVLQPGEEVVLTEKLDGANARFVWARDRATGEYRQFCGGRTAFWRDSPGNMWWRAFRAHPWLGEFCKAHPDWTVYGEVFGNVQDLKYGVKPNEPNMIRIFDVLAVDHFVDFTELETLFTDKQRVPIVYRGGWDAQKAIELSEGNSTLANHIREGVVVSVMQERQDVALGRVKLKLVSFKMLSGGKR